MIVDTFTFFNEFDILDMRFEELYPVVDHFVLVEADKTFSGNDKPYYFQEAFDSGRWDKYADKINSLCFQMPEVGGSWEREYAQRNAIAEGVAPLRLSNDDIVLVSDADEIPRRAVVASLDPQPVMGIGLDVFYYNINMRDVHEHTIRAIRYEEFLKSTPQNIRTLDVDQLPRVYHSGWHFSYLGDIAHIITKFQSFAHTELNRHDTTDPATLERRMSERGDLWGDGHHYDAVEIDDTWPEAVKRDRDRWRKFEWTKE